MITLNISVKIQAADEEAAATAFEQVKDALSGFDDIRVKGSVRKPMAGMVRVAGVEKVIPSRE